MKIRLLPSQENAPKCPIVYFLLGCYQKEEPVILIFLFFSSSKPEIAYEKLLRFWWPMFWDHFSKHFGLDSTNSFVGVCNLSRALKEFWWQFQPHTYTDVHSFRGMVWISKSTLCYSSGQLFWEWEKYWRDFSFLASFLCLKYDYHSDLPQNGLKSFLFCLQHSKSMFFFFKHSKNLFLKPELLLKNLPLLSLYPNTNIDHPLYVTFRVRETSYLISQFSFWTSAW